MYPAERLLGHSRGHPSTEVPVQPSDMAVQAAAFNFSWAIAAMLSMPSLCSQGSCCPRLFSQWDYVAQGSAMLRHQPLSTRSINIVLMQHLTFLKNRMQLFKMLCVDIPVLFVPLHYTEYLLQSHRNKFMY